MPLSAAHKAKISEGLKKYHACAREAGCGKPKGAVVVRRKFKRLRQAGSKAAPRKTAAKKPTAKKPTAKKPIAKKKKPPRRVALTQVSRPKRATLKPTKRPKKAFGTGMPEFTGLRTFRKAVGGVEAKYGGAVDMAPELGF